jgi:hypothetical protein
MSGRRSRLLRQYAYGQALSDADAYRLYRRLKALWAGTRSWGRLHALLAHGTG